MREKGQAAGALHVAPKIEVVGIDVEHGRVKRVRTTDGDIEAETVAITCGVWSPRVARMAGARVIATSSSDEKLARLLAMGASDGINYKMTPDWDKRVRELTHTRKSVLPIA